MNIRGLQAHTWVIDTEVSHEVVLVRFPESEIQSVQLTEELEFSVCYAYKEHLESLSEWSPHIFTVRDIDIQRHLEGKLAFV